MYSICIPMDVSPTISIPQPFGPPPTHTQCITLILPCRYQDLGDQVACKECADDTYNRNSGSTEADDCLYCPTGRDPSPDHTRCITPVAPEDIVLKVIAGISGAVSFLVVLYKVLKFVILPHN